MTTVPCQHIRIFFADSIQAFLGNGATMHSSRDSVIAGIQKHRNSLSTAVDRVDAVMAVKSTDKNEDWVLIWGKEIDTYKNGKIDSVDLQETWRINKDGKADMILQYMRSYATPKKIKSPGVIIEDFRAASTGRHLDEAA